MPLVAASVVTTNIGNNKAGARIGLHCPYKYVLPCYFTMYDIYKYVFLYVYVFERKYIPEINFDFAEHREEVIRGVL